jgi:hypothetical protein
MTYLCSGYEVVCPDGLIRNYPYHDEAGARLHARRVSKPEHFAERQCRLAPKIAKETARWLATMPPCPGGEHSWRPILFTHNEHPEKGEA